jgi:hypothetical protein
MPGLELSPNTPGFLISVMIVLERRDTLLFSNSNQQVSASVAFISKARTGRSIHVGSLVAHSFLLCGPQQGVATATALQEGRLSQTRATQMGSLNRCWLPFLSVHCIVVKWTWERWCTHFVLEGNSKN